MKKTYTDPITDFNYLFNQKKLIESYEKYVSAHKITKKELNEKLCELLHVSEESIRKHISNTNGPSLIEQIYEYGDFVERCIQAVRSGVINILAEYAATNCFNQKNAIDTDMVIYYRKKVDSLEIMIMQIH